MNQLLSCLKTVAVILPSLDPDHRFAAVVEGLVGAGFENIVIVDDGSDEAHQKWFDEARKFPQCAEQRRAVVVHQNPAIQAVVVGERMLKEKDKVVIGCRDFSLPDVPPRSVTGNRFTSAMFRVCFGIRITDTQTGLRAVPAQFLEQFTEIEGERFEYETNMLLQMKRLGIRFVEQPIETVYDKEEYSSHYNALKDSWRIFKVMARFMAHKR